ncbi:MAG: hypothetical protein ACREB3_01050 [Burkholderiales bacterium]
MPKKIKRGIFAQNKDEPRIYFFEDRDTVDDAMLNWLVEEFPDVRYFGVVEVDLPAEAPIVQDPELAGAVYISGRVPKEFITKIEKIDAGLE